MMAIEHDSILYLEKLLERVKKRDLTTVILASSLFISMCLKMCKAKKTVDRSREGKE